MLIKVDKVVSHLRNSIPPLPSRVPPITTPFSKALRRGHTIELAHVSTTLGSESAGIFLSAAVNWSATFLGSNLAGSWAEISFEILRGRKVIYTVHQSAIEGENVSGVEASKLTVFNTASLLHFDETPICDNSGRVNYTLRATNIIIADPNYVKTRTRVSAGAVTFVIQEIPGSKSVDDEAL